MKRLLIEAPGTVGEARLVARHLRSLMSDGAAPGGIVVSHRDLVAAKALLQEVFDDYRVPCDWPIAKLLKDSPALQFLKRAWQLPRRQFRFQPMTALLRNHFFQPPSWPGPTPLKAEQLLRHLGVPRHREDYLAAISRKIDFPFPALEDEHADVEWQQRFREELTLHRPFFVWLFDRWNDRLETAPMERHAKRLQTFAADLGLKDDADVRRLFAEFASLPDDSAITAAEFESQWDAVSKSTPIDEAEDATPRVRLMVPEAAADATCEHLILMGLGEGSFPRFDGNPDTTLATEQALWNRLTAVPTRSLTLSYPAVDARGQALLPSPFLSEYLTANDPPRLKRRMLIETYAEGPAYSAAEDRVQFVRGLNPSLNSDTVANLHAARRMAAARFGEDNSNTFNGVLNSPPLIDAVAKKFDTKTFSPTALERYVACPFQFWLRDVLRLEPPDEPGEDVEATHRGTVVHRALSRYHDRGAGDRLPQELNAAVDEDVERTPSRVMQAIWHLERRRLTRYFSRYAAQWEQFTELCHGSESPVPTPTLLEAHIGVKNREGVIPHPALAITHDGVTVRIGGVIDRVDVADLDDGRGYWILDYKTGKAANYTGSAIKSFEKLQLPLYALAVETLLPDARPLGLGYWLVIDGGVKPVLPDKRGLKTWGGDAAPWQAFRATLQQWVVELAKQLRRGDFRLAPRSRKTCDHCPYGGVCRINQLRRRHAAPMALPVVA